MRSAIHLSLLMERLWGRFLPAVPGPFSAITPLAGYGTSRGWNRRPFTSPPLSGALRGRRYASISRLPCRLKTGRCAREIPVTSLPRTFLDFAAAVRFEWLEKMVERSEELRLFDLRAIEELLARTAGHHGHKRLRQAIALYTPSSFTRSGLERRFLQLVIEAGLPQPHMNYVEHGLELDCYWPEHRFVVELDVFETHGTHAAFERDRKRQEDLLLAGIQMIRVTGPRLEREPDEVIRRVARLLSEREPCRASSRP
jgi:hypothetical protein